VHEVNAGLVAFEAPLIFEMLHRIRPHNLQEEYYLTDAIEELIAAGHRVEALVAESPLTTMGVNTRADLATVESVLRQRVRERLMVSGVTLIDPPSTFVDSGVEVGQDTVIYPFCVIEGKTVIGSQSQVGPGCRLVDAHIGDRVQISNSVVVEGVVPSGARLGPFAYLRDGRDTAAEAEPCAPSPPAASKKRAAKRR
jgi:bifunctional UDP-N-acetylglucosamine pyrophosphorylase/glucosamine-1-phosphate N-acetyltransferase